MVLLLLALLVCGCWGALRATPYGRFDANCVHKVPNGSHVQTVNGTVFVSHASIAGGRRALPKCHAQLQKLQKKQTKQFPPSYDGWLAYTSYQTTNPTFDNFLGYFSVPDVPQSQAEVLYIFTGLQNGALVPPLCATLV